MIDSPHIPVLYREVVESFSNIYSGIIIDCTMGYGGHTALLLEANPNINIIAIDQDDMAIEFSAKRLLAYGDRVKIMRGRFSQVIKEILASSDKSLIRGVLADIGVSSLQLDKRERGFSFESDTLDMRMNQNSSLSALDVVNGYSQLELERIFNNYGEIRNYKQLASFIVSRRPFYSSKELSDATKHLLVSGKKIHHATLMLQSIRIEVNDELGELERLLGALQDANLNDLLVAIISFHSLEDRIVKTTFSQWSLACICPPESMRCVCGKNNAKGKIVTKKPIAAKDDELKQNPRSRSAKMRLFRFGA